MVGQLDAGLPVDLLDDLLEGCGQGKGGLLTEERRKGVFFLTWQMTATCGERRMLVFAGKGGCRGNLVEKSCILWVCKCIFVSLLNANIEMLA